MSGVSPHLGDTGVAIFGVSEESCLIGRSHGRGTLWSLDGDVGPRDPGYDLGGVIIRPFPGRTRLLSLNALLRLFLRLSISIFSSLILESSCIWGRTKKIESSFDQHDSQPLYLVTMLSFKFLVDLMLFYSASNRCYPYYSRQEIHKNLIFEAKKKAAMSAK